MSQEVNKGLILLGGLGLGAGLMYLLDPDAGQQRRIRGLGNARRYWNQANEALDNASHDVSRRAQGLSRGLGRQTQHLGRQAYGLIGEAQGRLRRTPWPTGTSVARERQSNTFPALLVLGGIALGAGLMYLFDPMVGSERRQTGRHKARSYWRKTGQAIDRTTRELGERARGFASEVRNRGRHEQAEVSTPQS